MNPAVPFAVFAAVASVAAIAVGSGSARSLLARVAPPPAPADEPGRMARGRGITLPDAAQELPLLLDLLATATAAGMSATVAFETAASALRGPLGGSLRGVVAATVLGARPAEGIRNSADGFGLPDLARAASILERSGSLGVPVSLALRELADEHRRTRRRLAEQRARTAPVRLLFPLVFLVLPAFLLLTVVPMLLATLGSLS